MVLNVLNGNALLEHFGSDEPAQHVWRQTETEPSRQLLADFAQARVRPIRATSIREEKMTFEFLCPSRKSAFANIVRHGDAEIRAQLEGAAFAAPFCSDDPYDSVRFRERIEFQAQEFGRTGSGVVRKEEVQAIAPERQIGHSFRMRGKVFEKRTHMISRELRLVRRRLCALPHAPSRIRRHDSRVREDLEI